MDIKEISKKDPVSNGDKLVLTFSILNPFQMFAGLLNPTAVGTSKDEAVNKTIQELKNRRDEVGFVIDDYNVSENTLKVQVTVFDKTKLVKERGLGFEPITTTAAVVVTVEAIAGMIVVVALAIGINAALTRVEKITDNPIPALAILGVVMILLIPQIKTLFPEKRSVSFGAGRRRKR